MTRATLGTFFATLSLAACAHAAAEGTFRLTTADLAHRDVRVKSIDATNAVVVDAKTAAEQTLPVASLVELRRTSSGVTANDGWLALRTRDGQRVIFKPIAIRNDAVVCATRSLGERTIPIADVASIAVATLADESMPTTPQDELRLANGDRVRGIVSAVDSRAVTCQAADGQSVAIDWTNVRTIRFAETQAATAAPAAFVVALADGTRVRATAFAADGKNATLAIAGGEARVALADVVALEHVGGAATMLSWLAPTSATYEPYFPSSTPATAFVVDAGAAEANGATTAIRVRPKTTLRWQTGADARRLHARCAVPAGKAFADVTIRVLDGDRVAFERANVKSGAPPIDVDVPVTGGGSVALDVDYGDDFDVQDQALWLDAAVLTSPAADAVR